MFPRSAFTFPLLAAVVAAGAARAGDILAAQGDASFSGFYLHGGLAEIVLDEGATIKAGGQPVAGGTISVKSQLTFAVEAGYFLNPNIAVSVTGGFPPTARIEAAGSMFGQGRIGSAVYGPATVTAHYHFDGLGALKPYIGVGPAFMLVFHEEDGLLEHLRIRNTVGFAVQAGADLMLNDHWGVFVDVKKAFLRTNAVGLLGGIPVRANVNLDPLVLQTGVTYRF
jgi:outer membrane protein